MADGCPGGLPAAHRGDRGGLARKAVRELTAWTLAQRYCSIAAIPRVPSVPYVLQYNKRDLGNVSGFEELEAALNQRGVASFEAAAIEGSGVFATLKAVSKAVLNRLS